MTDEELDALDREALEKANAFDLNKEALRQAINWSLSCMKMLSENDQFSDRFKVDPFDIVNVFHEFRKMLTEPL